MHYLVICADPAYSSHFTLLKRESWSVQLSHMILLSLLSECAELAVILTAEEEVIAPH